VHQVPGAQRAGITRGRNGKFETVGPSDETVRRVDAIQYELMSGPCVDAIIQDTVFNAPDLRLDRRWSEFGRRAYDETGTVSMLAFRLFLEDDDMIAALNMYSDEPEAFDEFSRTTGLLLSTHGALALSGAAARSKVGNLQVALKSSREIGIALGVLMTQYKVTREQAFDLLRIASQRTHRKLSDIAIEVGDTGSLPDVPVKPSKA
jgi:ANTAR domain